MLKNLCLLLILTVYLPAESAPVGLGFDKLDTSMYDSRYDVTEEDLDDFSKLLDEADKSTKNRTRQTKTNDNISRHKEKNASKKGSKSKHSFGDFSNYNKSARGQDEGAYDDDEDYAQGKAYAKKAVVIKGNEDRKYKKGMKTRGFHRVHHKNEYKRDKVFFEDDVTSGAVNKVGAKGRGYKIKAGAGIDKENLHHDKLKEINGKREYKGFSDKDFSDYSQGFDGSFSNES